MKPITFQSFWWGSCLSPYEWLCLKSFVRHGHNFDLFSYDWKLPVPAGVRVCDASAIMPEVEFFTYSKGTGRGSPSAFSNLFRYKLLSENGGWWVDTDVVCLSSEIPRYLQFFALQEAGQINSAIMYFERLDLVMLQCFKKAKIAGKQVVWGDTGPKLITKVIRELGLLESAQESGVCYPLSYREVLDFLRPDRFEYVSTRTERALFVHLWNEGFRQIGISKLAMPPRGSWLRSKFEEYEISGWEGEYTDELLDKTAKLSQLKSKLIKARAENEKLLLLCKKKGERIEQMLDSQSWRITAPLRYVRQLLPIHRKSRREKIR